MPPRTLVLALTLSAALVGCHHMKAVKNSCNKPARYATAKSVPSMRVPPGVDRPDTHTSLRIPDLNEPAPPPRTLRDPCLDTPPLYAVPKQTRTTPTAS